MFPAMDFDTLIKVVSPILVAIISAVAKYIIEGKPRLITYLVHASEHPIPQSAPAARGVNIPAPAPPVVPPAAVPAAPAQQGDNVVHTHAYVVRNTGKKSAHNVRIGHQVFPLSYKLWPVIGHNVEYGAQDSSAEILIPVLTPGEQVTISYLYFPPLTWHRINTYVKSDEVMAKEIATIPTAPPPRAVLWAVWFVVFIGASTIVYWLLRLLPALLR